VCVCVYLFMYVMCVCEFVRRLMYVCNLCMCSRIHQLSLSDAKVSKYVSL
jgi:hypothetical protein